MTLQTRQRVAAAACVFAACAVLMMVGKRHAASAAAPTSGCPASVAPAAPPSGGTWQKTVDPGSHLSEVRAAVAALNAAGSALNITITKPGDRTADVRVLPDKDLGKNTISQTSGCLKPGLVSARATVTLDSDMPGSSDSTMAMTRQLAVAFGLQPNEDDPCSTLAKWQDRTVKGCGDGVALLQPVDRKALIKTWGPKPTGGRPMTGRTV